VNRLIVILGKTFSAEATAEHVKRPLYVVGAGDLGTRAVELDNALESVFDVATMWKAIVLIDEVGAANEVLLCLTNLPIWQSHSG
jgi:hypothetical protein